MGDHLRKRRLDLGLFQKDLAEMIGVCLASITFWETNRVAPGIEFIPKIIGFLGYTPDELQIEKMDLKERLIGYRRRLGVSQLEMSKRLSIDAGTLANWEKGLRVPNKVYLEILDEMMGSQK